jgi:hypothetical protein
MRTDTLPGPADTSMAFGAGRAFVRRVSGDNLWIVYQVKDDFIDLLAVKGEPPIPSDD